MPKKTIKRDLAEQNAARTTNRFNRHVETFRKLLGDYECDHPNWREEALMWLIKYSLRGLRHCIESGSESKITWDSPFVELRYPIDWNWKSWRKGKTNGIYIQTGTFTDANTKTKSLATATLAKMLVKHLSVLTLQEFTNKVGFEKRGSSFTPILASDISKWLTTIKSKRKRLQAMKGLYHPFSMGAARVNIDTNRLKPNAPVRKSVVKELYEATALIDRPPLTWNATVDGHSLKISLIFQIHQLVVDIDQRSAHFPITVGLHILPDNTLKGKAFLQALEEPWSNPKHWNESERELFWKQLFKGLHQLYESLAPSPTREIAEAVVSVTAKIKVASKDNDLDATGSAISKMLNAFKKTGQVIEWDCETSPVVAAVRKLPWSKISDQDFERLLFNLVSHTRGYENPEWLTHTNAPDKGRDISVMRIVRDPLLGTRQLRVVIQCKHKKGVGIAEVIQLREQMALWEQPRVDELIIATSGRFSGDSVQWIEKHNQSNNALRISMWPDSHLERILSERPNLLSEFFH